MRKIFFSMLMVCTFTVYAEEKAVAPAQPTPIPSAAQTTYADSCGGFTAQADQLFDAGRYNDALSAYRKAEPLCESEMKKELLDRVRFGIGRCFLKRKDVKKAIDVLKLLSRDAVDDEVKDISTLILAQEAFASGKDDEALIMLANITDTPRRDEVAAYALFLKAEHTATVGSYAKAAELFRLLDEEYASSNLKAAVYYYRAMCAIESDEPKIGLDFLDALGPIADEREIIRNAALLRVRAYAVMKTTPSEETAKALFAPFLADHAFTSELSDAYATMLAGQGKNALAAQYFSDAALQSENKAISLLKAARSAMDANTPDEAKKYLSRVLEVAPLGQVADDATLMSVYMQYDEGHLDKAKQTARERLVLSSTPDAAVTLLEALSRMYDETFEPDKIFDAYDAVMQRFPEKKGMFEYLKAGEYAGQSRIKEAYAAYDLSLSSGYNPADVRYAMARCKERLGDVSAAAELYRHVADATDATKDLRSKSSLRLAEMYADAGDSQKAKIYWTKTVSFGLSEAESAKKRLAEQP